MSATVKTMNEYVDLEKFQPYREHKNNDTNIHLDERLPCLALSF